MKKTFLKVIALVMTAAMLFSLTVSAAEDYTTKSDIELQFGEDGNFRILQFADCQDDMFPAPGMLEMIETAIASMNLMKTLQEASVDGDYLEEIRRDNLF